MSLDKRALRTAFGRFMTGVTVVTAVTDRGEPVGFTANSFTSVSLDPPLLLVCPGKYLSSYGVFETCNRFAINVLAAEQEHISTRFASYKGNRFADLDWTPDAQGLPLINGAIAQFSCRTHSAAEAGDHLILVGEITGFSSTAGQGLGYVDGRYFHPNQAPNTGNLKVA